MDVHYFEVFVAFAFRILFCFLLGKVAPAVTHYFSHMTKIFLVVSGWILIGVLHEVEISMMLRPLPKSSLGLHDRTSCTLTLAYQS